jgi:RHS repeat-associated protein
MAIAPKPSYTPPTPFGYVGAHERTTELPSGVIGMGARAYVPQLGRFLQVDPVFGGSANDYDYVDQDAPNQFDIDGRRVKSWLQRVVHGKKCYDKQKAWQNFAFAMFAKFRAINARHDIPVIDQAKAAWILMQSGYWHDAMEACMGVAQDAIQFGLTGQL